MKNTTANTNEFTFSKSFESNGIKYHVYADNSPVPFIRLRFASTGEMVFGDRVMTMDDLEADFRMCDTLCN